MKQTFKKTIVVATCVIATNLQAADSSHSFENNGQNQELFNINNISDVHLEFNADVLSSSDLLPLQARSYVNEQMLNNDAGDLFQQMELTKFEINSPTLDDRDYYYEVRGRFFKSLFDADQYIPLSPNETNSKINLSNEASGQIDTLTNENNVDNSVSWLDLDADKNKIQSSSLGLVNTINIAPILSLFSITQRGFN